jgi:myo-inositol 2-dehydrogenase/D-chiro-inositol 1-dehydrogenase
VHFIGLVLWYAESAGLPGRAAAYGGDPTEDLTDHFTVVLEWSDGATAVLNQCLCAFEHHTLLEIAGCAGGLRTCWRGT